MVKHVLGRELAGIVRKYGDRVDAPSLRYMRELDLELSDDRQTFTSAATGLMAGNFALKHWFKICNPAQLSSDRLDFELPLENYKKWFGDYLGGIVFEWGNHLVEDERSEGYIGNYATPKVLQQLCQNWIRQKKLRGNLKDCIDRKLELRDTSAHELKTVLRVFYHCWCRRRPEYGDKISVNYYRLLLAFGRCAVTAGVILQIGSARVEVG